MQALLYALLTDENDGDYFSLAHALVTDRWLVLTNHLKYFTFTTYDQLREPTRARALALTDRLIRLNADGVDGVVIGLLRRFDRRIVELLATHVSWIVSSPSKDGSLLPVATAALLQARHPAGAELLTKRLDAFTAATGRDAILALQRVADMDAYRPIWRRLVQSGDEAVSSRTASLLVRTLLTPADAGFSLSLLSPQLETWTRFLLDRVDSHNRRPYELWLAERFSASASDDGITVTTNWPQLVRFLVLAYHPTNAQLASGSVQRWMFILWILNGFSHHHHQLHKKEEGSELQDQCMLALLFDWLFFDPQKDSIMLIEPAILVLHHSLVRCPALTARLILFMRALIDDFYPPMSARMLKCVRAGMRAALAKRVIPSIEPLLEMEVLGDEARQAARHLFQSSDADELEEIRQPQETETQQPSCAATVESSPEMTDEADPLLDKIRLLLSIDIDKGSAGEMLMEWIEEGKTSAQLSRMQCLITSSGTFAWIEAWNEVLSRNSVKTKEEAALDDPQYWRSVRFQAMLGEISESTVVDLLTLPTGSESLSSLVREERIETACLFAALYPTSASLGKLGSLFPEEKAKMLEIAQHRQFLNKNT